MTSAGAAKAATGVSESAFHATVVAAVSAAAQEAEVAATPPEVKKAAGAATAAAKIAGVLEGDILQGEGRRNAKAIAARWRWPCFRRRAKFVSPSPF